MNTVKIPGVKVSMGGAVRIVPPLNLGALKSLQERLFAFKGGLDQESVALVLEASYLSLKRNYPDITPEIIEDELDVSNMDEIFKAIMDVSGLLRKAQELEELEKGELKGTSPLTGIKSSGISLPAQVGHGTK